MALATWGKIDTLVVHGWKGWLPSIQDNLDIYQRTGQRGRGMQIVGSGAPEVEITVSVIYDSAVTLRTNVEAVEKWQGRTVPVTDDYGRQFPRVRLNRIRATVGAFRGPGPTSGQAVGKAVFVFTCEVMP